MRAWGRECRAILNFHTKNIFAVKAKIIKLRVFTIPAMEWKAEGNIFTNFATKNIFSKNLWILRPDFPPSPPPPNSDNAVKNSGYFESCILFH